MYVMTTKPRSAIVSRFAIRRKSQEFGRIHELAHEFVDATDLPSVSGGMNG